MRYIELIELFYASVTPKGVAYSKLNHLHVTILAGSSVMVSDEDENKPRKGVSLRTKIEERC